MQCIAATRSVPLESWYVSVICAVYYIFGANGYHYCITIIALWSDVVCSFYVSLMMYVRIICWFIMYTIISCTVCYLLQHAWSIVTCLLSSTMFTQQESHCLLWCSTHAYSQIPSFYNMVSLCSPITSLQASLTISFNKPIPNSIYIVEMALELSLDQILAS